jgi:hypothetical protein
MKNCIFCFLPAYFPDIVSLMFELECGRKPSQNRTSQKRNGRPNVMQGYLTDAVIGIVFLIATCLYLFHRYVEIGNKWTRREEELLAIIRARNYRIESLEKQLREATCPPEIYS